MQFDDGWKLGQRVKAQRVRRGLTQLQLAGLSTVGVRTIRDLEAGRTERPHPITVQLLASALGLGHDVQAAFQVTAHSMSDLDEAESAAAHAFPIPTAAGAAVGRDHDVEALCTLVAAGVRLITVTGLPGAGKTRLTVETARTLHELGGMEVIWIAGRPSSERISPRRPGSISGARDAVAKALSENVPTVIVVDDADPEQWPDGVPRPPHPGVQVIVTARMPLELPEERVYPIPPLSVRASADPDEIPAAVNLFAERVNWLRPGAGAEAAGSPIAAELCKKLDGNPRLLIAAAEAFSVLEPESVLRLVCSDVSAAAREFAPYVHDGTSAIIGGLEAEDRSLLRRLCALPDDWSVQDVARELGEPALRLGRRVRCLLEKGLIRPAGTAGEPRFQALELVRSIVGEDTLLAAG